MKNSTLVSGVLLVVAILVGACGGAVPSPAEVADQDEPSAAVDRANSDDMVRDSKETMTHSEIMADSRDETGSDVSMAQTASAGTMRRGSDEAVIDNVEKDGPKISRIGEENVAVQEETTRPTANDESTSNLPDWYSAPLIDVSNRQTFTVAGFQGQVVLVETMAIWCPNCLKQQREVTALHEALGEQPDLVTLILDIDPNENAETLASYAAQNGFAWIYAVAPRDVVREIGQLYGDQFLNPPSTSILIIDRSGEVHTLPFGIKSAAKLRVALEPFLTGSG